MRDRRTLEAVERMVESYDGWALFKAEAYEQLGLKEAIIDRLIHKSRAPVDPIEIEYFRGFRQGVIYVLDALPHELVAALPRLLEQLDKESETA